MGKLFDSVKNWFRESKDKAADAIGDDIRDSKYAIQDSKEQIASFRTEISKFVAANRGVQRDLDQALSDVKKWEAIHAEASKKDAEDASRAAEELANAKRRAIEFKRQHGVNETAIANLRSQLSKAERKVANAESDHVQLAARKRGAEIRKELASASSKFDTGNSPLSKLDSLREAVEADEDLAASMEELTVSASEDLAEKYSGGDVAIDDEFDKMFAGSK